MVVLLRVLSAVNALIAGMAGFYGQWDKAAAFVGFVILMRLLLRDYE